MNQIERNKQMSEAQLEHHASLIRKSVKKRRACIRGCGTTFISRNAGHRVCDKCARAISFGSLAENVYLG
jgi:hypothetical protein